jgi:hypothetical protein
MFCEQHSTQKKTPTQQPIHAKLPDGAYMHSTHEDNIDLPSNNLASAATKTSIFPALDTSLISVGQFCDAGCTAVFNQHKVEITHNNKIILMGTRSPPGLWYYQLPTPTTADPPSANASIANTTAEHIQFLHAAAFSPVTSTWIDAINNGHFTTWPGLTADAVRKHLPKSFASAQGHLDQSRKNQCSTKSTIASDKPEPIIPTPEPNNQKTQYIYAATGEFSEATNMIHSDLTGRFPQTSTQGNKYILIIYSYDGNAILAEPMRSRTDNAAIAAYRTILSCLKKAGLAPKLQRLNNEASRALKDFLDDQEIDWQLVPPYCHRRNAAERAIRTFKNHFIAGLCSTDPNFNMGLWDKLIEQCELTLNLL